MNEDGPTEDYDNLHYDLVVKALKVRKETGEFETVQDMFSRLPIARLEKDQYSFLFDNIKQSVKRILTTENILQELQNVQKLACEKINLKKFPQPDLRSEKNIYNEKLKEDKPIYKCIVYIRSKSEELFPEDTDNLPFLPDQQIVNFNKISKENFNTKIFFDEEKNKPLRKCKFQFINENMIEFSHRSFPTTYEIQHRGRILAKLYLLEMYNQETKKMKRINKTDEIQLNRKRQVRKIKEESEIEKLKKNQQIDDTVLMEQVYKVLELVQKKMNQMAYEQFLHRNGEKAANIKKSLQKLKNNLSQQKKAQDKLIKLITYKTKKGW